jgi:hypothetical protein
MPVVALAARTPLRAEARSAARSQASGEVSTAIDASPRMQAQRALIERSFGPRSSAATQLKPLGTGLSAVLLSQPIHRPDASPASGQAPVAQLVDLSDTLKESDDNNYFGSLLEGSGDFVWLVGGKNQSLRLSHVHLFAVTDDTIRGQLTVRRRESDAGGVAFDGAAPDEDSIRAEVRAKYGTAAVDADARNEAVEDLKSLMEYVIEVWGQRQATD